MNTSNLLTEPVARTRFAEDGNAGAPVDRGVEISMPKRRAVRDHVFRAAPGLGIVTIAVGILFAGGAFSPRREAPLQPPAAVTTTVSTIRAEPSSGYQLEREFVGRVEARRRSMLSMELRGLLTHVAFDEGDSVQRGDVLATLDTQILSAQLNSTSARLAAAESTLQEMVAGPRSEVITAARAEVARWHAQRRLAEITRIRNRRLVDENAGSRQELDDATFGEQTFAAQARAAEARLLELENGTRAEQIATQTAIVQQLKSDRELIEINLRKSQLLAPFDGIISQRWVDEGTVLDAGTAVVELLETGRLDVRIGVSDESIGTLTVGSNHTVQVGGRRLDAVVRAVRPDRNQQTRTISVLLTLVATPSDLHVGDLATLQVTSQVNDAGFWVPITALTASYRGLWSCYVAAATDDPGQAFRLEMRELEVIHQTSRNAFVRGSLKAGERIVDGGIQRLVPNQRVRLRESHR